GEYVSGLSKEALTVLANKVPQKIIDLTQEDPPISVGILFDISGSIGGASKWLGSKRVTLLNEGLAHFVQQSSKENDYFLISFNDTPKLLLDATRDNNVLMDKLCSLEPRGATALYDACYMGIEKI